MKEMETGMLQEVYVCMHITGNVWRRSVVVCFPLHMKNTSFSIKKTLRGRMAIYYQKYECCITHNKWDKYCIILIQFLL